ncbi:MAG: hypothetical protein LBI14_06680 [Treponema sp.]|jgi:hypothetical protein|nr:hypothetical protein [Treponema sp.]
MESRKKTSIATGLVKPKTTALFFDKLWVPALPDRFDYIPEELLFMNLPHELLVKNLPPKFQYKLSQEYWCGAIGSRTLDCYFEEILKRLNDAKIEFPDKIIFDSRRNGTLLNIVDICKREINMDITPIFNEKTEFKSSAAHWVNKLSWDLERREGIPNRKINVLEVCIRNIPSIIEEQLHWQQVLEVRQDKKSFDSIKRLKRWFNAEFAGKSEGEIIEGLERSIEDYSFSIKKHGVTTMIGSISSFLTSSASAITVLAGNALEIVSAYFVVSTGIFTFASEKMAECIEKKRWPIAFLYNTDKIIESNDKVIINTPDKEHLILNYRPNYT